MLFSDNKKRVSEKEKAKRAFERLKYRFDEAFYDYLLNRRLCFCSQTEPLRVFCFKRYLLETRGKREFEKPELCSFFERTIPQYEMVREVV